MLLHSRSVLSVALLSCCFFAEPLALAYAQNAVPPVMQEVASTISVQELKSQIAEKKPVYILDVRQQDEYDAGDIDNAVLMPLNTLPDHYKELPKDKKIVAYCRSGKRSAQAVEFLRAQGLTNVVSLSGGYTEWTNTKGHKF